MDYENKTVTVDGTVYPMLDTDFPTVDPKDPYALTPEEDTLISTLTRSFQRSEKLQRHVRFLYSKGSLYRVYNGNLLFHGCIPMHEDGTLMRFSLMGCEDLSGREFWTTPTWWPAGPTTTSPAPRSASRAWTSCGGCGRAATPPSSAGTA